MFKIGAIENCLEDAEGDDSGREDCSEQKVCPVNSHYMHG